MAIPGIDRASSRKLKRPTAPPPPVPTSNRKPASDVSPIRPNRPAPTSPAAVSPVKPNRPAPQAPANQSPQTPLKAAMPPKPALPPKPSLVAFQKPSIPPRPQAAATLPQEAATPYSFSPERKHQSTTVAESLIGKKGPRPLGGLY